MADNPISRVVDSVGLRLAQGIVGRYIKAGGGTLERIVRVTAEATRNTWPDSSAFRDQARMYKASSWVYIAINLKANAGAQVGLNVFRTEGEKKIGIDNHPLEVLMRAPNGWQTQYDFMFQTLSYLCLTGNAYWFLNGAPGVPTELICLRPDRMRIAPGPDNRQRVKGYVYDVDGTSIPLDSAEVVHFAMFSPDSDYYGLSPMEVATTAAMSDVYMARWNGNLFGKDAGIPAGVVNVKAQVSESDYERLKRNWLESYGGGQRKTAFLRGDVTYQDIGMNHKDADFVSGRQQNKEEVFQIFGVPPGLIDKNATEANSTAAMELFTKNTVFPLMVQLAQKISKDVAPLYEENLIVEADDVVIRNANAERAELAAAAPYMTINEVRIKYFNLPKVPWGDTPQSGAGAVGITGQPVGKPGAVPKPEDVQVTAADKQERAQLAAAEKQPLLSAGTSAKAIEPEITVLKAVPRLYLNRNTRAELAKFVTFVGKQKPIDAFTFIYADTALEIAAKAWADVCETRDELDLLATGYKTTPADGDSKLRQRYERLFASAVEARLSDMQTQVVTAIKHVAGAIKAKPLPDSPKPFLTYMNDDWWRALDEQTAAELRGIMQDAVQDAAEDQAKLLEMQTGIVVDPSRFSADAADYAQEWTDSVLEGFGTTTQKGTGALLARWIGTPNATLEDLVSAVQESTLFGRDRAILVGVTESTRAMGMGAYDAAQETASVADVPMLFDQSDVENVFPGHPKCLCGLTTIFKYDSDDRLIGIDMLWKTVGTTEKQCVICPPRNNRTISEIVAEGL